MFSSWIYVQSNVLGTLNNRETAYDGSLGTSTKPTKFSTPIQITPKGTTVKSPTQPLSSKYKPIKKAMSEIYVRGVVLGNFWLKKNPG